MQLHAFPARHHNPPATVLNTVLGIATSSPVHKVLRTVLWEDDDVSETTQREAIAAAIKSQPVLHTRLVQALVRHTWRTNTDSLLCLVARRYWHACHGVGPAPDDFAWWECTLWRPRVRVWFRLPSDKSDDAHRRHVVHRTCVAAETSLALRGRLPASLRRLIAAYQAPDL